MDPLETYGCEEAQARYSGCFKVMGLIVPSDHFFPVINDESGAITTAPQLILTRDLLDALVAEQLGDVLCISHGDDGPRYAP